MHLSQSDDHERRIGRRMHIRPAGRYRSVFMLRAQHEGCYKLQTEKQLFILIIMRLLINESCRPQRHHHRCTAMTWPSDAILGISHSAIISAAAIKYLPINAVLHPAIIDSNQLIVYFHSSPRSSFIPI
ncbi:hypothetical protein D3C80_1541790 [compost metagenome]